MISILVICLAGHRKGVQLRNRCRNTNTDLHTDLRGSFVVPRDSHKHIQAIRLSRHLGLGCHLLGFPRIDSNRK